MKLTNIKIGYKLSLGFGLILIITTVIGLIGNRNIDKMWQHTQSLHDHPLVVSKAVRDIRINIIAMHRSMKDVALANNYAQIGSAEVKVDEYERQVFKSFEIVFDRFLGDMSDVQSAYDAFVNWKPIRDEVIQLSYAEKNKEAAAITIGKGADHVEDLNLKIQTMIDFANQKGDGFYQEALSVRDNTIRSSLILLLAIVFIGLLLSIYITYSITKPLSSMLTISKKLTKGDLTARNKVVSSEETGMLASSINELARSIETRIAIQQSISDISEIMIGKSSMQDFATQLLKQLMKDSGAHMSTFYILNEATLEYEHFTSIGATKELLLPFDAENPQGEFGNALSTKSIFYLKDIPENTDFKYKTIAGDAIPKEIITMPLLMDNSVIAFISLVNIQKFSEDYFYILKQSWTNINTAYSNLLASERTRILSEHLSMINQELEAQSEELQDQSEELQDQTEELQRSSKELQEQNIELENQKKQVEGADKLKSEFLSNMSHELRTPLNSIMALSRVLITQAKDKLNDEENNYLEIVERNGKRLLSLINNILDLSKIESGKIDVAPELISISNLLHLIKENNQALANEKNLNIILNIPESLPNIETDEPRLHQILLNVVSNAVKFTKDGAVDITVEQDSEHIFIKVKDSGIGISDEMLPHIFDEFRQADGSSSRQYEGTGLGLAIAYKLTQILGGTINAESKLGEGSLFTISIPIKWMQEMPQTLASNFISEVDFTDDKEVISIDNTKKRILIVEDNPDAIVQLKAVLKNENYAVNIAGGGQEALDYLQNNIPDGIILDLMMPDIDGFEVLNKIRNTKKTKNIPVLILTAKDLTKEDLSKLSSNNIQQLIHKGDVDIEGLLLKVSLMLGKNEGFKTAEAKEKKKAKESIDKNKKLPNISVVEDNPDNMITIKAILKNKFNIVESTDGEQGLKLIQSFLPDMVLLDMSLPKIDGEEIASLLKENNETRNIPIIAVTAQTMKGDKERFLEAGCDGYISKPIDPVALLNEISKLLNEK